ncbi:L-aminopeptidase/D-esterase [Saccharopolyspora kobensis]|uniref:L-aminopeptidase/D-esterase n=1 Tax=Saccharopolyspora kobensis TaxID=146035 RepID=A0A1H6CTG8_9PSEU|nr:P1 family peptidase [Saccharopolyspora kobensis]SEG76107.1 L-aminopeptidase/D-esterase [Saccharopolyspora kobensis]SFC98448.1 L-aminopeptidase/D-esterase [Saccharopolyspora kobensis]
MGAGERDALVDVDGVLVGHEQRLDPHWATGTTAVLVPEGASAAVDVRGGGPGTRETDVLEPSHLVQQVHGIVLTGGSAYGLAAADGAMRWLGERGHGVRVGPDPAHVVPVVPSAVIFDLPMNDWGNRPDAEFGYRACQRATRTETREGNVGAGTGAVVGCVKGGIGTASTVLPDGTTIGALVAVNAAGSAIDPDTGLPWIPTPGLRRPEQAEIDAARPLFGSRPGRHGPIDRPLNTTIGVVATDLRLSKAECRRLAVAAQDALARAVRPAHLLVDGDTMFALATGTGAVLPAPGEEGWSARLDQVSAAAADVVARAIVRGMLAAEPVDEVTSYTWLYPSARE